MIGYRNAGFPTARRQRGSIGLVSALTLGLAVLFMALVIDSGRLYFEQRSLQRLADVAALEAISLGGNCQTASYTAVVFANTSLVRNNFTPTVSGRSATTTCGSIATNSAGVRQFTLNAASTDAVRVVLTNTVTTSLISAVSTLFSGSPLAATTTLSASAVAGSQGSPMAALTIRSTLAAVDTAKANTLNLVFGGLLGSSLNVSAAGWQGLLGTNVNLLSFLNQLAMNVGVTVGDYNTLLSTVVTPTQLTQALNTVLQASGVSTVTLQAVSQIQAITSSATGMRLGDLLQIQSGVLGSALNINLQAYSLLQGVVQLANVTSVATASLPSTILGQTINTQLKVIQPAQLSALGDPRLAQTSPMGSNRIYVRTAQTRALVTLTLPALDGLSSVTSQISNLLAPVTSLLNSVLSLNLSATLSSLVCALNTTCSQTQTDILVLPAPVTLSLSLDVASGASYVTGYTCPAKTLTTQNITSAVDVSIGKINPATAFSSTALPVPTPLAVIDIGTKVCTKSLLNPAGVCQARVPFAGGGMGFMVNDAKIAQSSQALVFNSSSAPTEINQTPSYQSFSTASQITTPLAGILNGVTLQTFAPGSGSTLGGVLPLVGTAFTAVQTAITPLVDNLLSAVLTPLLSTLSDQLGINLAQMEVGANLSCNFGGRPGLML